MTPREYLTEYVERNGGLGATAKRLRLPYPTLASIVNGHRGVSAKMAQRMVSADPLLDANKLIWIRAEKPAPEGQAVNRAA